jgi:hypothetical protein
MMRRRLGKFVPIVLIAVLVQIFAPIGATWAASIAASDPLHGAVICHGNAGPTPSQTDQSGQHRAHDGCCSVCNVVHSGAPVDAPQAAVTTPWRHAERVVWLDTAPDLFSSRAGSNAQARAPPSFSLPRKHLVIGAARPRLIVQLSRLAIVPVSGLSDVSVPYLGWREHADALQRCFRNSFRW